MARNPVSYFWEILKMSFQGAEGKVGSWALEVSNNSIEFGAKNIDVELPEQGKMVVHDDGDGIDKKTFVNLFGLIKGKNRIDTFNRWNEGLKKILCLVSEMYVETKHETDGFNAGIFRWKNEKGDFIEVYDPIHLPDPSPIDDWEPHIRHKRNIMKYERGTSLSVNYMFYTQKKVANRENIEKWYKKYYHLLMNGINYDKINFRVNGKLLTNELSDFQIEKMTFKTNIYGDKIEEEKFKVPIIFFKSDTPIHEDNRGVFIVVNGIRVEEIKVNTPTDLEDKICVYFCADFFAKKNIAEDGQGLVNRDKTGIMDGSVKKRFIRQARSEYRNWIGDSEEDKQESDKELSESTKKLNKILNKQKFKDLLKLPGGTKKGTRATPKCPECGTQNFTTWKEDENFNICKNGHKWMKSKWERTCPKCKSIDYETKIIGDKEVYTCNVCGHEWKKQKRIIRAKELTSKPQEDYPKFLKEVRFSDKYSVIYINSGTPTYKHIKDSKSLRKEHNNRCLAGIISEIAAELNEFTEAEELRLYYEVYEELYK